MSTATLTRGGRGGELAGAVERLGSCGAGGSGGSGASGGGGLAALADKSDPLSALLGSPASFLIDHIGFVREGFNYLTGDPDAIQAHANGLRTAAGQLNSIAADRDGELSAVTSIWQGADATAYNGRSRLQVSTIQAAAQAATQLAARMEQAGDTIGNARQLAKDGLDSMITGLIPLAAIALGAAVETGGSSVLAFIADAVGEALSFANKVAQIIQDVETVISDILTVVQDIGKLIDDVTGLLGLGGGGGATSPAGSSGSGGDGGFGTGSGGDAGSGPRGDSGGPGGDRGGPEGDSGGSEKERPKIDIGRGGKWGVQVPGVGEYHWDPEKGHSIGLGDDGPEINVAPRHPADPGHGAEHGSGGGHEPALPPQAQPYHPQEHYPQPPHHSSYPPHGSHHHR